MLVRTPTGPRISGFYQEDEPRLASQPTTADKTWAEACSLSTPILQSIVLLPAPPIPLAVSGPEALEPSESRIPPGRSQRPHELDRLHPSIHHPDHIPYSKSNSPDLQDNSPDQGFTQPVGRFPQFGGLPQGRTSNIDQEAAFWEAYNGATNIEDREFVRSAGGDLDVLLIFAGLFSATNTAFIIEAYKGLKADPADEANKLLRSIIEAIRDPTSSTTLITGPDPFCATPRDVRINMSFFFSLCCSLCAAFGAVLAKQWLTQYDRDAGGSLKPPSDRGRERQRKYEGRDKWCLEHVIATLPTLLQFSLFFFLMGLVEFTWPLNTAVTSVIISCTTLTYLFYGAALVISAIDRSSPFQTRLSALLQRTGRCPATAFLTASTFVSSTLKGVAHSIRVYVELNLEGVQSTWLRTWLRIWLVLGWVGWSIWKATFRGLSGVRGIFKWSKPNSRETDDAPEETGITLKQDIETRCVVYLLERSTLTNDLDIVADALDSLGDQSSAALVMQTLVTFHLKPSMGDWWQLPGLYGSNRVPLLKILRVLFVKWRYCRGGDFRGTITSSLPLEIHSFLHSLHAELWRAFFVAPEDAEALRLIVQILEVVPLPPFLVDIPMEKAIRWFFDDALSRCLATDNAVVQGNSLALLEVTTNYLSFERVFSIIKSSPISSTKAQRVLFSRMWIDISKMVANLDGFWLSTLRVRLLTDFPPEDLFESGYAEYLALWFKRYAVPYRHSETHHVTNPDREASQQRHLHQCYLGAIGRLVTSADSHIWSKELERCGHIARLLAILRDHSLCHESLPPAGGMVALSLFLSLWNNNDSGRESKGSPSLYLMEENARAVVGFILRVYRSGMRLSRVVSVFRHAWALNEEREAEECVGQIVEMLLSYLKATVEHGLLGKESLTQALDCCSEWCEEMGEMLGAGRTTTLLKVLKQIQNGYKDEGAEY